MSCGENAECKTVQGKRDCNCKDSFEGDPFTRCTSKSLNIRTHNSFNTNLNLTHPVKVVPFKLINETKRSPPKERKVQTILLTDINPCDSNPCNAATTNCNNLGNGDYECECKDGFKEPLEFNGKQCEGNKKLRASDTQ